MGYNYDVSVKTTNTKSKSNHLQTLTHIELEKIYTNKPRYWKSWFFLI